MSRNKRILLTMTATILTICALFGPAATGRPTARADNDTSKPPPVSAAPAKPEASSPPRKPSTPEPQKPIIGGSRKADTIRDYLNTTSHEEIVNQLALDEFKSWLMDQPGIYENGYLESIHDRKTKTATLMWAGNSPLQTKAITEASHRGIVLKIQPRKYSKMRLSAAINRLWQHADDPAWNGLKIGDIGFADPKYDGLQVHLYDPRAHSTETQQRNTNTPQDLALIARKMTASANAIPLKKTATLPSDSSPPSATPDSEIADILVSIAPEPLISANATRGSDYPPWNSGGAMQKGGTTQICSSGFGLRQPGTGYTYTTTAQHCDPGAKSQLHSTWWYRADDLQLSYGKYSPANVDVYNTNPGDGGGAIALTGSASTAMFDGAWNDANGYSKQTTVTRDVGIGDEDICTSGANTGVHCGLKVTGSTSWDDGESNFEVTLLSLMNYRLGDIAAGPGDSGGPVLTPLLDGTRVRMVGMIQGGTGMVVPCPSMRKVEPGCTDGVAITTTRSIIQSFNSYGAGVRLMNSYYATQFGYPGEFLAGSNVKCTSWRSDGSSECFGIAYDRSIWHAWPSSGWQSMPGGGLGEDIQGLQDLDPDATLGNTRRVVVYVSTPYSHWYQDYNRYSGWSGYWTECKTGAC
jgi:hypothetical protein